MNIERFQHLLGAEIGLDVVSIGSVAIVRAIQLRMRESGITDPEAYWHLLSGTALERQQLIEAVVVPETWFFRDAQAFIVLGERLRKLATAGTPLRIVSLPCSTGEEPYSIAMALLDAGVPAARFSVDAIDISERALVHAQIGIYGRNAFRGGDLSFRDRYFAPSAGGYRIDDRIRAQVRFRSGNLLDANLFVHAPPPHAVFCRNLLIYFDRATQARALAMLHALLDEQALLFVAPAEAGLVMQSGFDSLRSPLAFAFKQISERAEQPTPPPASRSDTNPVFSTRQARRLDSPAGVTRALPTALGELTEARALAGAGRLNDAEKLAELHLLKHGPSAGLYYLLGLLRDASSDSEAAAVLYRKALYLEPQHTEALVQLAYLLEKRGDQAGAQRLRGRASRSSQADLEL